MKRKYWALFLVEDDEIVWDSMDYPEACSDRFYGGPDTPISSEAVGWDGRNGYVLVEVEEDA
jgi:hypothetical protein